VNVGHIDRTTLNLGVLSSFSPICYIVYLFSLSLCLSSLVLEAHYYNRYDKCWEYDCNTSLGKSELFTGL